MINWISFAASARLMVPRGRSIPLPSPCTVLDVSAGGILIASQEEYQQGDRLSILGVRLTRTEDAFNFNCYVRRVGGREMGFIRYGCQFETLSSREQDRLLRAIFTVQREEIRRQREKGEEI